MSTSKQKSAKEHFEIFKNMLGPREVHNWNVGYVSETIQFVYNVTGYTFHLMHSRISMNIIILGGVEIQITEVRISDLLVYTV